MFSGIISVYRKWGFNRARRQSFKDWLEAEQVQHPNMHFFFPTSNVDAVLDGNLQSDGYVDAHNLTTRQVHNS